MENIASKLSMQDKLQALRLEYAARLPKMVDDIVHNWQTLQKSWQIETFHHFHRKIHRIAGNADNFGFSVVGQAARTLDSFLLQVQHRNGKPNIEEQNYIRQQLVQLRQTVKRQKEEQEEGKEEGIPLIPSEFSGIKHISDSVNTLIYLVEDDEDMSRYLAMHLTREGYEVQTFSRINGLIPAIKRMTPGAIIMDVMLEEGDLAGPQVIYNIQKNREKPLPVIFVSARTDMKARLAAVRANGDAYFTKPFDIAALIKKLEQLINVPDNEPYRILIVDDGGVYADKYAKILRQARLNVKTLDNPMRIIDALQKFQPAALLINTLLNGVSGLELAMVVRQQEASARLPILFFAKQFDQTLRRAAMRGIGDDYISNTVSPAQLVATVINRIKQSGENEDRLQTTNTRDLLTGLYNRRYLLTQLELYSSQIENRKHSLIIIYISMDSYQGIDRIMGLAARDTVISDTALLLQDMVDKNDLLAHFSDSTFVIVSSSLSIQKAVALSETIRLNLEKRIMQVNDQHIITTCSIGIAMHLQIAGSPFQTLLNAEAACKTAEKNGGNCIKLDISAEAAQHSQQHQHLWEDLIVKAIEFNQFYLAYQPIDALHGESMPYYDVLLRLKSDLGEEVLPSAFLPIAEQSDLILKVDRWVVKQAMMRMMPQRHAGEDISFFVRLSGNTLQDDSLLSWAQQCLDASGLPPHCIVFDVSQTVAIEQLKNTQRFVECIKKSGCRFCLRDFDGTPGNLKILKLLSTDFIKLASELVQHMDDTPKMAETVNLCVEKAHTKGALVIAPFVEDATILSLLWDAGIDYITGHFVQTPEESLDYDFIQ